MWRAGQKRTFQDDVISGQPLIGSIEPGLKWLTRKIVAIGRGVCMRLLGEGELCKFKLKVNRWRFGVTYANSAGREEINFQI